MPLVTPPLAGWAGTTCLVTGGLGFIGSNLVRSLVDAGSAVRVVDALVADHGGRPDQLDGVATERVEVARTDSPVVRELLEDVDVVFNVAGQVSHTASMRQPHVDLDLNAAAQIGLLDSVRTVAPTARVIYASTRQVYGRGTESPVDECKVPQPIDVNGVAKLAAEQLHLVYGTAYGLATTALRLTNVYGPRQRLTSDELGFLPVFLRKALNGEPIEIFGDGQQRRDCVHVTDVVTAFTAAATTDRAVGRVYNAGHREAHTVVEIANVVLDAAGSTEPARLVPWPEDHARIDIGSFHTGSQRILDELGWEAAVTLVDGIQDTVEFYRSSPWFLSST